jgi:CRISPR-associated protein Csm3
MKLSKIIEVKGLLLLQSGLHIGGGDTGMHIGGTDNPVIKHPHTQHPYIPGSSLKGKMRSLLEWHAGLVGCSQGEPIGLRHLPNLADSTQVEAAKNLVRLFGVSGGDSRDSELAQQIGPTRLAFRDCELADSWLARVEDDNLPLTEIKFENSINRISGTATNPRNTERVPAGASFDFVLSLKVLADDDEDVFVQTLLRGMRLIELDALGGSGSRGYGKVKFDLVDETLQARLTALEPFSQVA